MSSAKGKRKAPSAKVEGSSKRPKSAAPKMPRRPKGMVELPVGSVLTDLTKKCWKLGKLIGWGGFGALYLASSDADEAVGEDAAYVIKVEPHANGPLFTELAFYQRVAKPESIKSWMKSHKMKHLGVPFYLGSGSVEHGSAKLRFMVMERFGQDVDKIFLEHDRHFDIKTVLTLGIRVLDILEYIHSNEYAHADIKGSNLMMGYARGKTDQVYLLDYGLTFRFSPNGQHKEYKEDPKRRHDGTVEFTSRDAHKGVAPSRRGDLEVLGYVMLQWLCGRLPWENKLEDKEYVKNQKIRYMDDIPGLMKDCSLGSDNTEIQSFLKYVTSLQYEEEPDYSKLRQVFQSGLKKRKASDDGRSVTFLSTGTLQSAAAATNCVHERRDSSARKKVKSTKPVLEDVSSESSDEVPKMVRSAPSIGYPKKTKPKAASGSDSSPASPKKTRPGPAKRTKTKTEEPKDKPPRRPRAARVKKTHLVDMATSPINWPKQ